jgi:hypothetical protein
VRVAAWVLLVNVQIDLMYLAQNAAAFETCALARAVDALTLAIERGRALPMPGIRTSLHSLLPCRAWRPQRSKRESRRASSGARQARARAARDRKTRSAISDKSWFRL